MSEIIDIFGVDWKLLLVQAFNFGLLLLILWYFLYKPILALLEKRQAAITEGMRKAEQAERDLSEVTAQKEIILTDATKEAGVIIDRAKERALSKEDTILKEAEHRASALVREAQERAQEEKRQTLLAAQEEIATLTILGVKRVLLEKK